VNASSAETILFVGRILGARATPPAEIASVISAIADGIAAIRSGTAIAPPKVALPKAAVESAFVPPPAVLRLPPAPVRVKQMRQKRRVPVASPVLVVAEPEPEAEIVVPPPKLLRRAQMPTVESPPHMPVSPTRDGDRAVRGVVKWFDSKAAKGALRLTGIAGDVPLDSHILQSSSIRRLYKDQEIEATIEQSGDRVRLLDLKIPGRSAPTLSLSAGAVTGLVRRQPRQVTVEVKRDGNRQRQARAEAEQLLGAKGSLRPTRGSNS
jgi:cold shock CspA family protein